MMKRMTQNVQFKQCWWEGKPACLMLHAAKIFELGHSMYVV